ncbi:MAG: sulfite exporter TauE/SafE family protein [Verrucomicrobiota bacterium]
MIPETTITTLGAFLAGLATSVHCLGMCGPLACLACQSRGTCATTPLASSYHGSRLAAYTIAGAIAGAIGGLILESIPPSLLTLLPWFAGVFLIAWAVGWSFNWFPSFGRLPFAKLTKNTPTLLGLATPLIPCAPLYLIFGLAAFSGSPVRGAAITLAFGLGTVPLLWLAQHQLANFRARFGQRGVLILQRSLVFSASVLVLWRLGATAIAGQPTCCHQLTP